ncbi:hypothetical protein PQ465_08635 [Sphingobacterium oryzagri]|uniref:DoxX family protein n=1 Tax=Sphingobacterium oryzagri TaxID=3025669 RepID=A0ABY7WLF8_9SPHI|nr:hypothetical protein [Sphingobacterium sp. KACC 22765]WDF70428.1 hypothetical protein PQ465_08635 [Sphingobacterium sp. KACC 22765]
MSILEKKINAGDVQKGINHVAEKGWPLWQLIAFRISFVFFIIISIPNNPLWYQHVLAIDWLNLDYRDLYDVCRFGSGVNWFGRTTFGYRLEGYSIWVNTFFFAVIAGLLWTLLVAIFKKPRKEYNRLYYWLNVVVRYRAGLGIIGFGFTKLFPVQMPYPSFGILNTDYGDLTTQKIFWLSFGIVPWYQVFAGVVEVGAGTLLFFRKTVALGAMLLVGALGAIVAVNFAYDGGVHVYSSYFVLLSLFLLVPYFRPYYDVFVREIPSRVNLSFPTFKTTPQILRLVAKAFTIFLFLGVFFYLQYVDFRYDPYKQPSSKGVAALRGNYNVTEFKINAVARPFDPNDSIRWQSVTFERWSTMTFNVNRPLKLDLSNGGGDPKRDVNRTFEISGVAGGQRAFHYYADSTTQTLYLEDKYKLIPDERNVTAGEGGDGGVKNYLDRLAKETHDGQPRVSLAEWIPSEVKARLGDEAAYVDSRARTARRLREFAKADQMAQKEIRQRFVVSYKIEQNGNRVVLQGIDENRDSLYVVLDKVKKDYKISPGKLDAGQYD